MIDSRHQLFCAAFAACVLAVAVPAKATIVGGGGSSRADCMTVLDAAANSPEAPKTPKNIDCTDGDTDCDADHLRNGECVFNLTVCVNSTALENCSPQSVDGITVAHADDNGDPKFDPDFQAVKMRVDQLDLPGNTDLNLCADPSSITVKLRPGSVYKKATKKLSLVTAGSTDSGAVTDKDRMKITCRPEGDGVYGPIDLYAGTFDRIRQTIFAQSCALSSCHDSQSSQAGLVLYPNVAYSETVGVTPTTPAAAADGLQLIFPGDETKSFLYRKITNDLAPGYGASMPFGNPSLSADQIEIIRLWILGNAPEDGWVPGTDQ